MIEHRSRGWQLFEIWIRIALLVGILWASLFLLTSDCQTAERAPSTLVELKEGRRVVTGHLFRVPSRVGVRFSTEAPPPRPSTPTVRRPSRVARMLALAHRIEAAITHGEYQDRADAARQLGITRARLTQLMDLTQLAPDLQEELLFSEAVDGVEPMVERGLRGVLAAASWADQRQRWRWELKRPGAHDER